MFRPTDDLNETLAGYKRRRGEVVGSGLKGQLWTKDAVTGEVDRRVHHCGNAGMAKGSWGGCGGLQRSKRAIPPLPPDTQHRNRNLYLGELS